jgi:rhodanese-related sulfurtransferase
VSLRKSAAALVDAALARVETIEAGDALGLVDREDVVLVDLRDIRERVREGFVPGSVHAPRGMLEFWVDPESPYHREIFAEDRRFVFYCAGGWRSALAAETVLDMGLAKVAHIGGGFTAWMAAGGPVLKTGDGREPKPAGGPELNPAGA